MSQNYIPLPKTMQIPNPKCIFLNFACAIWNWKLQKTIHDYDLQSSWFISCVGRIISHLTSFRIICSENDRRENQNLWLTSNFQEIVGPSLKSRPKESRISFYTLTLTDEFNTEMFQFFEIKFNVQDVYFYLAYWNNSQCPAVGLDLKFEP